MLYHANAASLLSALDSLSTAVPVALRLLITVILRAACCFRVSLRLVEGLQHEGLCVCHVGVSGVICGTWQC